MNRKLLVTLLQKDIQELEMITEGFMEMTSFPKAIILLAQRKTEDIQSYIQQLATLEPEIISTNNTEVSTFVSQNIQTEENTSLAGLIPETEEPTSNTDTEDTIESAVEPIINEEIGIDNSTEDTIYETDSEITTEPAENDDTTTPSEITAITTTSHSEINSTPEPEADSNIPAGEPRKTILSERNALSTQTRNDTLSKSDNTISDTLANKKVSDIKQAINIGDRFRFQRELFKANGEDMNKTLTYINQLATLDEALSFLRSKYNWADENETAEDFYQTVKRRFI